MHLECCCFFRCSPSCDMSHKWRVLFMLIKIFPSVNVQLHHWALRVSWQSTNPYPLIRWIWKAFSFFPYSSCFQLIQHSPVLLKIWVFYVNQEQMWHQQQLKSGASRLVPKCLFSMRINILSRWLNLTWSLHSLSSGKVKIPLLFYSRKMEVISGRLMDLNMFGIRLVLFSVHVRMICAKSHVNELMTNWMDLHKAVDWMNGIGGKYLFHTPSFYFHTTLCPNC